MTGEYPAGWIVEAVFVAVCRLLFAVRRSKSKSKSESERDGSIFLLTSCSDGSEVDAKFEGCIVVGC